MGSAISPLGRLLAVVEVTLGIAATSKVPWAHASFALRMIPGEFDGAGVSFVTAAARSANEDLAAAGIKEIAANPGRMQRMLRAPPTCPLTAGCRWRPRSPPSR